MVPAIGRQERREPVVLVRAIVLAHDGVAVKRWRVPNCCRQVTTPTQLRSTPRPAPTASRTVPSATLSADSDWLLAALVLLTAVQIDLHDLVQLRRRLPIIVALAVGVLLANTALAYLISRPFHGATQQGVLSLGLASTEVASVGLIGLAGGETALALGILTTSLVASAILGPLLAGALTTTTRHGGSSGPSPGAPAAATRRGSSQRPLRAGGLRAALCGGQRCRRWT
jgi:hypothetical protein